MAYQQNNNNSNKGNNICAIENALSEKAFSDKINHLLNGNGSNFVATVLHAVRNNDLLAKATPVSIMNAALTAAALDLPIQIGCAYIVPFKGDAQLQIGYRGFYQLAMRTNKFERLDAFPVYSEMLVGKDRINGFTWNWNYEPQQNEHPIGYFAFLKLSNGFTAEIYMTINEMHQHAYKFSTSYQCSENEGNQKSIWHKNFNEMATKTVLKLLLSKKAPLSIFDSGIQTALEADQAVIKEYDVRNKTVVCDYVDNVSNHNEQIKEVQQTSNQNNSQPTSNKDSNFYPQEKFDINFNRWVEAIKSGTHTPDSVIKLVSSKSKLTNSQIQAIKAIQG